MGVHLLVANNSAILTYINVNTIGFGLMSAHRSDVSTALQQALGTLSPKYL